MKLTTITFLWIFDEWIQSRATFLAANREQRGGFAVGHCLTEQKRSNTSKQSKFNNSQYFFHRRATRVEYSC